MEKWIPGAVGVVVSLVFEEFEALGERNLRRFVVLALPFPRLAVVHREEAPAEHVADLVEEIGLFGSERKVRIDEIGAERFHLLAKKGRHFHDLRIHDDAEGRKELGGTENVFGGIGIVFRAENVVELGLVDEVHAGGAGEGIEDDGEATRTVDPLQIAVYSGLKDRRGTAALAEVGLQNGVVLILAFVFVIVLVMMMMVVMMMMMRFIFIFILHFVFVLVFQFVVGMVEGFVAFDHHVGSVGRIARREIIVLFIGRRRMQGVEKLRYLRFLRILFLRILLRILFL